MPLKRGYSRSLIPALTTVKRADGGPVYDPMGNVASPDLERTEPEAYPNKLARATIQSVANMPKAALWDAPIETIQSIERAPLPGSERTPEGDAAMTDAAGSGLMAALGTMGGTWMAGAKGALGAGPARLTPAVRVGERVYRAKPGGDHLDAFDMIPNDKKSAAMLEADNRGFLDDRGRFLDREQAQRYALDYGLLDPSAPSWAKTSRELIAENLAKPDQKGSVYGLPDAPAEPAAAAAAGPVGPGGGGAVGARSLPEAQAAAARWAGNRQPLPGLQGPLRIGEAHFVPGPIGRIHDVAEAYMQAQHPGLKYAPPERFHPIDPEHSKAIAQAYEDMKHAPDDPAVKTSYDALIRETEAQFDAIKKTGLKIEPIPAGMEDPYAANPRLAAWDVAENNHLWFFPTENGFGTLNKISDNPMLRDTGQKLGGHKLLANDMFRIVHDYFGHLKQGHGFRAAGEDNAWRTHAAMYSDLARPAMTTETRGQNSAVNYSNTPLYKAIGEAKARELYGDEGRAAGTAAGSPQRGGVSHGEGVPGVQSVARDDGSLLQSEKPQLGELRGARDYGSPDDANPAGLSGRHGAASDLEASGRPVSEQQRQLRAGERSVGDLIPESGKSTSQRQADVQRPNADDVAMGARAGDFSPRDVGAIERARVGSGAGLDVGEAQPLWKTITVGEHNRKASGADTIYADQKVGLLPDWTMYDRGKEPIYVYTGSPHKYDKPDISKVGIGEGNQAYGHGLYAAGHEPVGQRYRVALSTMQDPLLQKYRLQEVGHVIGGHLADAGGDAVMLAQQYKGLRDRLIQQGSGTKADANMIKEYDRRIEYLMDPGRARGHMYKQALEAPPEHLLDYDAPFKDQSPYVQGRVGPVMEQSTARQIAALRKSIDQNRRPGSNRPLLPGVRAGMEGRLLSLEQTGHSSFPGKEIYKRMGLPAANESEGAVNSTNRLREMGIPAMRYLDAGSRVATGMAPAKGTHNYVVFDDNLLRILRRYGIAGLPFTGVIGAPEEERERFRGGRLLRAGGGAVAANPALWDLAEEDLPNDVGMGGVTRGIGHIVGDMLDIPQRAFEVSERLRETGEYDPGPVLDAASLPMGGTSFARVPAKAAEMVLGAGPVHKVADDTGAAMRAARSAKVAKGRSHFVDPDTGMAIPGRDYTKEAQAISGEIAAGPKEAGPLDLSLQGRVPGVEQRPLERYVPPRGLSPRMQDAIDNPAVMRGLTKSMREGAGVRDWYHTEPLRQEFIRRHGPDGDAAFKRYMDLVAATSPRSDVPTNIRNASYYYAGGDHLTPNPYPYGHVGQNLHKQNVGNLAERGGWDVFQNPKPASFSENLRGNLEPVTVDTHAFRNIGMRTGDPRFLETTVTQKRNPNIGADTMARRFGEEKIDKKGQTIVTFRPQRLYDEGRLTMKEAKNIPAFWATQPNENEYAAAENLFRKAGERVGMRPADAQAAAWSGAGDLTGLGTVGTHTFPELVNERVMFTAKMRGQDPRQVLQDFVDGRKPLLARGGAVDAAMDVARNIKRAKGGKVHLGPIVGDTGGRADKVAMRVPNGAYVFTADHVSGLGEGNTEAGMKKLGGMFPKSKPSRLRQLPADEAIPIYAADGEFVVAPEDIVDRFGELDYGHRALDAWQTHERQQLIETLKGLAPPAQD